MASDVLVRPLGEGDLVAVCEIVNHYIEHTTINFRTRRQTPQEWQQDWLKKSGRYPWLVAERDGEVVGVAYAGPWSEREAYDLSVEISVYLRVGVEGSGIGRALYARLFAQLDAAGYATAMAGVALPNPASVGLHEAFGFRPVGVLQAVGFKHGRWLDVAWYQRFAGGRPPTDPPAVGGGGSTC